MGRIVNGFAAVGVLTCLCTTLLVAWVFFATWAGRLSGWRSGAG